MDVVVRYRKKDLIELVNGELHAKGFEVAEGESINIPDDFLIALRVVPRANATALLPQLSPAHAVPAAPTAASVPAPTAAAPASSPPTNEPVVTSEDDEAAGQSIRALVAEGEKFRKLGIGTLNTGLLDGESADYPGAPQPASR